MASPIELDLNRWTQVNIRDKTAKIKCLSFPCFYYRTQPTPPELASEGTEIATNAELTMEHTQGPYWFRTKKAAATEEQKPSILEFQAGNYENIGAGDLAESSVEASKIKAEAVEASKAKKESVPVPVAGESLTAVAGVSGVARMMTFAYTAKAEASAKVKLIHNLNTEMVVVFAFKTSTKLPSEKIADGAAVAGAISKAEPVSANETLVTLVATEPAAKGEYLYVVIG